MDSVLVVGSQDQKLIGFLEKLGHNVSCSKGSQDVPRLVQSQVLDIILVDGQLGQDGVELCEYFRTDPRTQATPILFLSTNGNERYALQERGVQRVDFVESPYSIGKVVGKVSTLLRLRKVAGSDESSATLGEINAALRDLNARMQKELVEARKIQQSLIPDAMPSDDRVDIAAAWEPLDDVGGDWYYVKKLPSGKIAVQIADATGHGLPAAFICSMTKMAMVAANKEAPHELLGSMNRLMAPQIPEGKFVTMFSYLYDPETGKLDFARAGHPQGLLLSRKRNKVIDLLGNGFAVGFFEDAEYAGEQEQLDVGDVVVVMTDCIPEAQNMAGEIYGMSGISKVLLASDPKDSSSDILHNIINAFDEFRDGRILKDDFTLIALKRVK